MTADPNEIYGNCKCGQVLRYCDHPGQCCDCFDVAVTKDINEVEAVVKEALAPLEATPTVGAHFYGAMVTGPDGLPLEPAEMVKSLQAAFDSGELKIEGIPEGAQVHFAAIYE